MTDLIEAIHKGDPYRDFPVGRYPVDLQGWGSTHPWFEQLIAAFRPRVIIEVGTWKGASAIHMAGLCRKLGIPARIVCVDTWLGSPEHVVNRRHDFQGSLRRVNGYPSLFYTFMANVIHHGLQDMIVPLPQTSENAALILRKLRVAADLVYIDAAHEYEPALRDFGLYWPLLRNTGAMLGDDYLNWPGVTRAADTFAGNVGRPLAGVKGKFAIAKRGDISARVELVRPE